MLDGRVVCPGHYYNGPDWVAGPGGIRGDDTDLYLYVIHHPYFGAIKIGRGKNSDGRLRQHRGQGWNVITVTEPVLTGDGSLAIERTVVQAWRDAGVPIGVSKENMPQAGYKETAPGSLLDAQALARWVNAGAIGAPPLPGLARVAG